MERIDKQLYDRIIEDYNMKIQSADEILLSDMVDENERIEALKKVIDMLELFQNNKYILDGHIGPIDLSLPADNGESFGFDNMKADIEILYRDDTRIRDIYFQYWLIVNDDKYLEPIISYTNLKIGFLFNCLYLT